VENRHPSARGLLQELFPFSGRSRIIGITGSAGTGKSTLVDGLIEEFCKKGCQVGIVAVDPSSPFSGGAILGDRIRMMRHSGNPDVYIRSMATRGHPGGLAKSTCEVISILEAAGKDIILLETVGVGQDEIDVVRMADVVCVILVPGFGDEIQAFKAGIMEIADLFVINKADLPETEQAERQVRVMLEMGEQKKALPPILKTIASQGKGICGLQKEIDRLFVRLQSDGKETKRKNRVSWMLRDIIVSGIYSSVEACLSGKAFDELVEQILKKKLDPYSAADRILKGMKG
jgi:LAO/AO transport system kinase